MTITAKDIIEFIQTTGFPIFVATYVLLRIDKTVKENTEAIREVMIFLKALK